MISLGVLPNLGQPLIRRKLSQAHASLDIEIRFKLFSPKRFVGVATSHVGWLETKQYTGDLSRFFTQTVILVSVTWLR